jgi:hypothetical protein
MGCAVRTIRLASTETHLLTWRDAKSEDGLALCLVCGAWLRAEDLGRVPCDPRAQLPKAGEPTKES